jgi:hypothetical protein
MKRSTPSLFSDFDESHKNKLSTLDKLKDIVFHKNDYEDYVLGDYIYSILCHEYYQKNELIIWIRENLLDEIHEMIKEIIGYIVNKINKEKWGKEMNYYSFELFDISCLLDTDITKKYYQLSISECRTKYIYDTILNSHLLEKYKLKYKKLKLFTSYMSNGLLYFEANEDYQRYKNSLK